MDKKIRLGYDILSMRAIETESGINIDEALRRKDQEIAEINESVSGKMDSSESSAFYPMATNPSGYLISQDLNGYATEQYVTDHTSAFITSAYLNDYAKTSALDYVSGAVDDFADDLNYVSANIHDAKLKLQLGSGQASDTGFTANAASDTTVTIPEMNGATSVANGTAGLVPAPAAGDEDKVLKGDGTWGEAGSTANVSYDAVNQELHIDFSNGGN